jgi:DNA uptake protein ComE-like DNA-binding protein
LMLRKILTAASLAALLSGGPVFAQATGAAPTGTPPYGTAPSAAAPAVAPFTPYSRPSRRAPAPTTAAIPSGTKVNLNTASPSELDKLPRVGKARSKAIVDERAKGPFRDWTDFDKRMQRTSVNNGVKNSIKDLVGF